VNDITFTQNIVMQLLGKRTIFVSNKISMLKKLIIRKIAVMGIISALALSGCGLTVSNQPSHSRGGFNPDHRREYQTRLTENDRRIGELRESRNNEDVFVIEVRNNNMKKKLNEFNGKTEQEWISFKIGFNQEVREIERSLKSFPKNNKKRK